MDKDSTINDPMTYTVIKMNNSMIKKNQNNQNHHVILRLFFFKFLKRKKKKKKKIIQNIYIFTIKSPEIFLKRGQGLKINIRLFDQFK